MRIWLEKGKKVVCLQQMWHCLHSVGRNVGLLMGMHSDNPGCCLSSAGITHLCADLDLLFSGLKSQPDHKGKNFLENCKHDEVSICCLKLEMVSFKV